MKKLVGLFTVLLLCMLLAMAGCTGIPGKSGSSGTGSSAGGTPIPGKSGTMASGSPAGASGPSWSGTWLTAWHTGETPSVRMVLVQSGSTVTGTYAYNEGKITGTVQGAGLVGTWDENNGADTGPFEFDMAPDGSRFAGWYTNQGEDLSAEKTREPYWIGVRSSQAAPGTGAGAVPGSIAPVVSSGPPGVSASESSGSARPPAGSVQPVDPGTLKQYLPAAPDGWEAGAIEEPTKGVDDDRWSYAIEHYSTGSGKNAAVTISDSAYYDVADWDTWDTRTAGTTSEGTWTQRTVQGYPAWELDSGGADYYAWIGIDQRFMVKVVVEGSRTDLDTFVNAIDLPGIAALG